MKDIVFIGKRTWIHKNDLFAIFAIVVIFLLGAIMVQTGKLWDAEVEAQRQAEMLEIEKDKRYNDSLID
jgi:Na+-translocating ferredoxin:NAD+ oxidoreductase RnfG subunit